VPRADRTVFALFVAAALSVSALAVIAKILSELGLMRRDFGQITVAAGMANDVVGWVMLAVFTGFATSGEVSISGITRRSVASRSSVIARHDRWPAHC
jgi:Kef-type K+ transport system membrane component KefB